jgi:hypothetical protein
MPDRDAVAVTTQHRQDVLVGARIEPAGGVGRAYEIAVRNGGDRACVDLPKERRGVIGPKGSAGREDQTGGRERSSDHGFFPCSSAPSPEVAGSLISIQSQLGSL